MSEMWSAFEHRIWKHLKEYDLAAHDNFILAVSGGLDSMVLLNVFLKLKPRATFKVAYYHHGKSGDKLQDEFRNSAYDIVQQKITSINLTNAETNKTNMKTNVVFYSEQSPVVLKSEVQMRNSRWGFLRQLVSSDEIIVTAHHLDDFLETMLLKMIRGTSADGLISFKMWNKKIFRPFLETSKLELLEYAQINSINWVADPSNTETHYLRNWLREKWLKDLEKKVKNASKNLAKSLLRTASALSQTQTFELVFCPETNLKTNSETNSSTLSRSWYVSLSKADQLRSLALLLKKHQIYDFTTGQLEEIRKRLDKNRKDITFEILGRKWVINASQIMLQ